MFNFGLYQAEKINFVDLIEQQTTNFAYFLQNFLSSFLIKNIFRQIFNDFFFAFSVEIDKTVSCNFSTILKFLQITVCTNHHLYQKQNEIESRFVLLF